MSNMEHLVGEMYRVDRKIGKGSYGVIYLGTNITNGERVAIKTELRSARKPKLASEYKIYRILSGGVGISRVYWFGRAGKYNALVLDVLGPSLYDLFKFCGRKFTLKTVLMLADQLIARIKYIHGKNFIHRDMKPANFVMGLDMRELNQVYIIDFGLSKNYSGPTTQKDTFCGQHKSLVGTARYASINAHQGMAQSRRDDLESLSYILIYFALGRLPWQGVKASTRKELHSMIMKKKNNVPIEILCQGLPEEFETLLLYSRSLDFHEKPEYNCLSLLFRKLFLRKGYSKDYLFDWTVLNMKYRACTRKSIDEVKDNSNQESSSKETKTSDKSEQQPSNAVCITTQRSNNMKILQIANFI
jgi:serine/threonine protein kinase